MSRNSFQELEQLHEERYRQKTLNTQEKLGSSIRIFHLLGDLIDLFLPKVFQVFVQVSGGDEPKTPEGPSSPNKQTDVSNPKYPDLN